MISDRPTGSAQVRESTGTWLLAAAIIVALASRLVLLFGSDFPFNDGGPFVAIIDETARTFPALPASVQWNGLDLPFAYPPLALWFGALLKTAGIDAITTLHVMPVLMNIGLLALFTLLLFRSGHSRIFTAIALLFLSIALRSFEWLVMGGGLTRGAGSCFFVASMLAASIPGPRGEVQLPLWRMALAGAFVGGAILSHLEWGLLAASTHVVNRAFSSRSPRNFVTTTAVAGISAGIVIAPWLIWLLSTNGLAPLLAASGTSGWNPRWSAESLVILGLSSSLRNPFVFIGGLTLLLRRQWFWIALMLVCIFVTPRHGLTPVTLPLAVFAAQGVVTGYELLLRFLPKPRAALPLTAAAVILLAAVQVYTTVAKSRSIRPLSRDVRNAMAWIAANHQGAKFVVYTAEAWQVDKSAEWFATMTNAQSLNTVQGREWLPDREFDRSVESWEKLRTSESCQELLANLKFYPAPQFIWVETRRDCFSAPAYRPVYQNGQVTIFQAGAE